MSAPLSEEPATQPVPLEVNERTSAQLAARFGRNQTNEDHVVSRTSRSCASVDLSGQAMAVSLFVRPTFFWRGRQIGSRCVAMCNAVSSRNVKSIRFQSQANVYPIASSPSRGALSIIEPLVLQLACETRFFSSLLFDEALVHPPLADLKFLARVIWTEKAGDSVLLRHQATP